MTDPSPETLLRLRMALEASGEVKGFRQKRRSGAHRAAPEAEAIGKAKDVQHADGRPEAHDALSELRSARVEEDVLQVVESLLTRRENCPAAAK